MSINRVSTFAVQQTLMSGNNKVLSELVDLQRQLSSGLKASTYADLGGGQAQILASLNSKMERSKTFQESNTLILNRLQNTNQALTNIVDIATSINSAITQQRDGAIAGSIPFQQQMDDYQKTLGAQLNANTEGRYLFSGNRTNVPPIKSEIPDPTAIGTPDSRYYQGGDQDVTVLIQDDQPLTYNVRADDPAFQKIYAAIAQAKDASSRGDKAAMDNAYTLIQQGLQGVIALQAKTNTDVVNLQNVTDQQKTFQTYWQNTIDSIDKTDIVSVSTQVALDESTLQASYQAYAKIVNLRLSDYLR